MREVAAPLEQARPDRQRAENDRVGHKIKNGDIVQLKHILTNTILLTHDVASPMMPTNQEFTTVSQELADGDRHADTLFEIKIENGSPDQIFRSLSGFSYLPGTHSVQD